MYLTAGGSKLFQKAHLADDAAHPVRHTIGNHATGIPHQVNIR